MRRRCAVTTMLSIQLNLFMLLLLFVLVVHAYFRLDRKEPAHQLFFSLLVLTIVILVLEICSVLLNSGWYKDLIVAHKVVDTLGFVLTPWAPILAALYVYKKINRYKRIKWHQACLAGIPAYINDIVAIGSYYGNWIFAITPENVYVRGPLFYISPGTSMFYYLVILWIVYSNRKKISAEAGAFFCLFSMIPAVLSFFQLYYFVFLTIWNSVAIAVVINYIFIFHSQTRIDPLTGLANRLMLEEYLANVRRKNSVALSAISIDLDDFKDINDTYGHHEGDKVLRYFGNALREIFEGKGIAIRSGGDEFIVLLEETQRDRIEQYMQAVLDKIRQYNGRDNVLYEIHFSYGVAILDKTQEDINEFIRQSDKYMYDEKLKKLR